ncbi:ATP-binding cassette domain-containing protein [Kribbella sp. NPDC058245]|uniref:ATP-binding cassette domain-containing protein n=1 Tax=Kribbella sp. NPDC058245 TaxID=3346399 RepID=UPI0036E86A60
MTRRSGPVAGQRLGVVVEMLRESARADLRGTVLIALLVFASAVGTAVVAIAQRRITDSAAGHDLTGVLLAATLAAVGFTAMNSGQRVGNNLREDLTGRLDIRLTETVLRMTCSIPTISHLEQPRYLDRIVILRQGIRSLAGSCWTVSNTAASVVSLLLSLWLLADVDPRLIALGILAVPPILFARRGNRAVQAAVDDGAQLQRLERELHDLCLAPEPAKEVWIAGGGAELSSRADHRWQQGRTRETRANAIAVLWQLSGWICYAGGVIAALILVTSLVLRGRATVGDVILVITLASGLRWQLAATIQGTVETGRASHVIGHYLWLKARAAGFESPAPAASAQPRLSDGLQIRGLGFHYPDSDRPVLRDLDFDLPAGGVLGLVGINGTGKTTLVKLLTGLHEPTSGTITVDGVPLSQRDRATWIRSHSGTFQDFVKFPTILRHTVGLGDLPRLDDETAVADAVARAGAAAVVARQPDGYGTQLSKLFGGVELSHGQWQKLAVARGLMAPAPRLLVLDEPSAALDPQAEHDLFVSFAAEAAELGRRHGTITLLVSHRFSTVAIADHILVLDQGSIIERGTHQELMAINGLYSRLYSTQASGYRSASDHEPEAPA